MHLDLSSVLTRRHILGKVNTNGRLGVRFLKLQYEFLLLAPVA